VNKGFAGRARLSMGRAESPDLVAEQSLKALGRGSTVRPGVLSKVLGYSLAMAPRRARTAIMGMIMQGMTKHHGA
jgi:hypothetical protein